MVSGRTSASSQRGGPLSSPGTAQEARLESLGCLLPWEGMVSSEQQGVVVWVL